MPPLLCLVAKTLRVFPGLGGQLPQPSKALPQILYPVYYTAEGLRAHRALIVFLEPGLEAP